MDAASAASRRRQDIITELFTDKVGEVARRVRRGHLQERGARRRDAHARGREAHETDEPLEEGREVLSREHLLARQLRFCRVLRRALRDDGSFTYDHVTPRKQGGETKWDNIVAACRSCNDKKGARTPEQAKMKLLRKPFRPKTLPLAQPVLSLRRIPAEWEPYIASASA